MLYASHYGPFSTGPSWYCSAAAVPAVPTLQRAHPHLLGCTVYLFADLPYVCLPSRRLIIECTSLYSERERERESVIAFLLGKQCSPYLRSAVACR